MIRMEVPNRDNERKTIQLETYPDYCGLCHKHQEPSLVTAFRHDPQHCQLVFRCTNNDCLSFFIAYYYERNDVYRLKGVRPEDLLPVLIEDEIKEISPSFCEIYQQSHSAEKSGYEGIAGCGYRKALEFLIKDYCIKNNSTAEGEIKNAWLGKVIHNYIDDATIKECAEKATWLGNDETHYVRLWREMDIKDLKEMLDLTKYWIVQKMKTEKYLNKMRESSS